MTTIPLPTPTQNPVPSTDIRDAVFAGAKLDEEVTGTGLSYTDRLGGNHLTAAGRDQQFQQSQSLRESQFSAQLSDQESRFENFLSNSGYQLLGDYVDGPLTVDEYNQVIRYDGELWKLTAETAIPFTTTGNDSTSWASDSAHFVSVGDAALRQELAATGGAGLIGDLAKPVTWDGFAGGADSTGVSASDAAFTAAGVSGETCYVPAGTYLLNTLITTGTWIISDGVTFTGTGGIRAQAFRLSPLIIDYGLTKGGRWVTDAIPVKVHRFRDRVFVAGSANNAGGISATSAHSWLDDPDQLGLIPGHASLEQNATFAVATESGLNAGVFATRSSDYVLSTGSTIGLTAVALNDKATVGYRQGALGFYVVSALSTNASSDSGYSQTGIESNLWNQKLDASQIDPYNFFPTNLVKNIWLSNGFPESEHTRSNFMSTCAIGILNNVSDTTKAKYRTGIAFKATSIEGSDGVSGRGIAISMARGHSIQWYYAGGAQGPYLNSEVDSATNEVQVAAFTNFGFQLRNRSNSKPHLLVASIPTVANYPRLAPSATGAAVRYMVEGDDTNIDLQLSPKGTGIVKINSDLAPVTANSRLCGTSSLPWSGGFTQTAFTITSDERSKTTPVDITDDMLNAWSEVEFIQFQYLDRVEAKGDDGARWHFGVIAQRATEAFARHGLDAHRFAFLCFDEWEESTERRQTNEGVEVSVTRAVQQPVMTTVQREVEAKVLQPDGSSVTTTVMRSEQVPLVEKIYAFDGNGDAVIGEDGEQHFTYEPVMEEVMREVTEPAEPEYIDIVTPAGNRYGIRYEEALALEAALQRRNAERLLKRVEALESRFAQ